MTAKSLLDQILPFMFISHDNRLYWSLLEGTPIDKIDNDLAKELKAYIRKSKLKVEDYSKPR